MEAFRKQPPAALFRAAVLIGSVALLLGVAGIFYFGSRDRSWRDALPLDAATVLLRGVEATDDLIVLVRWADADGETRTETGAPGHEAGFWYFREAPEGVPLRLRVIRAGDDGREVLHTQHAIFTRGGGFEVLLRRR